MAAGAPAGSRGVLYTPWIWGERAPVEDRTLRAGLFNLSLDNDRADVIRAILEGVAFNSRWLLGPVERFLGRRTSRLRVVGGGAISDVWCQIYADILGIEVVQMQEPLQANARGAAFLAAVGLGELGWDQIAARVRVRSAFCPDPSHRRLYDEQFATFLEVYRRMRGVYRRLNASAPRLPAQAS
jgi:xylulokinase